MNNKDDLMYNKLNFNFTNSFEREYSLLNMKGKQELMYYSQQMYRRWLYSALVPNTMVTPANFFYYVSEEKIPMIRPGSFKKFCGFETLCLNIGYDTHYILEDAAVVKEASSAGIRIVSSRVEKETEEKILKKLKLADSDYLIFLIELLKRLGLIKPMASINTCVYTEVKSEKKIDFGTIIKVACEITADKLNNALNGDFLDENDILFLIKSVTAVDKVAEYILESAGVYNAADVMKKEIAECTAYEKAVYILLNRLIPAMDKYFIAVFGFYLRLIKPVYTQRYCMKYEMEMIAELLKGGYSETEKESHIYRCPAMYTLTKLGAMATGSSYNDIQGYIFNKVDPELLLISIDEQESIIDKCSNKEKSVYTIKIDCRKVSDKDYTVKFLSDTVLNEVWGEIYRLFDLEDQLNGCKVRFCFDIAECPGVNTSFASDEIGDRSCFKAELSDLVQNIGQHFVCSTEISYPNKIISDKLLFNMTVLNINKDSERHFYPVVVKN